MQSNAVNAQKQKLPWSTVYNAVHSVMHCIVQYCSVVQTQHSAVQPVRSVVGRWSERGNKLTQVLSSQVTFSSSSSFYHQQHHHYHHFCDSHFIIIIIIGIGRHLHLCMWLKREASPPFPSTLVASTSSSSSSKSASIKSASNHHRQIVFKQNVPYCPSPLLVNYSLVICP